MDRLRIGLVGLGTMGRGHLKTETELPEIRFAGVADVDPAAVQTATQTYGLPGFSSYQELLDSGSCDAVLIATPHPFHNPIAQYAAERGLHVLTEKPIAVTVREADAMVDATKRAGVLFGVMFQMRLEPQFEIAHRLLAEGAIGPIYRSVLVANHWYRTQAYYDSGSWRGTWAGEGGGVLMNQSPHSLDMLIWLGGMPRRVQARTATRFHRIEVEDTAEALLEFEADHTGHLYTTTAEWPGEERYEFTGEIGKLVIAGKSVHLYRSKERVQDSIDHLAIWGKPEGKWQDIPVVGEPGGHAGVVARFARAVRLGEPLVATGEDGRNALELANAIMLSGDKHEAVDLPLDRDAYDQFLNRKRAGV
ncbi:MAG TPA: Gfo/Idh/MocA family oxidoreductase [Chloroflexota bacterium]|nr:Gfo/Idh/MocA family oxidoreductase [Chloroflexota bacterium]